MPRSRVDDYKSFVRAATSGNANTALRYVAPGFRADLGPGVDDLSFRQFMDELARQRAAFPNLGQEVQYRNPRETDSVLDIDDVMTVRFSGVLRSRAGRRELQGDGRVVSIPQHHHVEYDSGGKIIVLVITSLQSQTLDHMVS